MSERADIAIKHACKGFDMTYEDAIELLRKAEGLTDAEKAQRNILIAAVDNLVDFSVAEEYQMTEELPDIEELELEEELDDDMLDILLGICHKYNNIYAWTENLDIEYAMIMAEFLSAIKNDTVLTYMTMGDERVRPWHLQYEGYSAPKSRFPAWLIPPIEHGCRCFLIEDPIHGSLSDIQNAAVQTPEMPDWFNRTFKESVALGGRIFSDEHPYFQIDEQHIDKLSEISNRIKTKYLDDGGNSNS